MKSFLSNFCTTFLWKSTQLACITLIAFRFVNFSLKVSEEILSSIESRIVDSFKKTDKNVIVDACHCTLFLSF